MWRRLCCTSTAKIAYWNDSSIALLNPNVTLPQQPITVIVQNVSAVNNFLISSALAASVPEFNSTVHINLQPTHGPPTDSLQKLIVRRGVFLVGRWVPVGLSRAEHDSRGGNDGEQRAGSDRCASLFVRLLVLLRRTPKTSDTSCFAREHRWTVLDLQQPTLINRSSVQPVTDIPSPPERWHPAKRQSPRP